jgi:hypothetical protein
VTLAATRAFLGRGAYRSIVLTLTPSARRLLAGHKRLPARLTVVGTVIGVIEAPLSQQTLQLQAPTSHGRRHH